MKKKHIKRLSENKYFILELKSMNIVKEITFYNISNVIYRKE